MKVMEKFGVPEPQWILDRMDSGSLYWRRDPGNNARVKFRCDVEVKEFCRCDYEMEDAEWPQGLDLPQSSHLAMGMTAVFCLMFTAFLPLYILGIN